MRFDYAWALLDDSCKKQSLIGRMSVASERHGLLFLWIQQPLVLYVRENIWSPRRKGAKVSYGNNSVLIARRSSIAR